MSLPDQERPEVTEATPERKPAEIGEIADFLKEGGWNIEMGPDGSFLEDRQTRGTIGPEDEYALHLIEQDLVSPVEIVSLDEDQLEKLIKESPEPLNEVVTYRDGGFRVSGIPAAEDLALARKYGEYRKLREDHIYSENSQNSEAA